MKRDRLMMNNYNYNFADSADSERSEMLLKGCLGLKAGKSDAMNLIREAARLIPSKKQQEIDQIIAYAQSKPEGIISYLESCYQLYQKDKENQ